MINVVLYDTRYDTVQDAYFINPEYNQLNLMNKCIMLNLQYVVKDLTAFQLILCSLLQFTAWYKWLKSDIDGEVTLTKEEDIM